MLCRQGFRLGWDMCGVGGEVDLRKVQMRYRFINRRYALQGAHNTKGDARKLAAIGTTRVDLRVFWNPQTVIEAQVQRLDNQLLKNGKNGAHRPQRAGIM